MDTQIITQDAESVNIKTHPMHCNTFLHPHPSLPLFQVQTSKEKRMVFLLCKLPVSALVYQSHNGTPISSFYFGTCLYNMDHFPLAIHQSCQSSVVPYPSSTPVSKYFIFTIPFLINTLTQCCLTLSM